MPGVGFAEGLRRQAADDWRRATEHRFVRELADGSLDAACFRRYLAQDYAFIETLVTVVGFAVARADSMAAKKRLAGFLGVLTSDENDYFQRAFDAVGASARERRGPPLSPVTAELRDLMLEAGEAGGYADVLSVMLPAEWVYLTWGQAQAEARPAQAHYREWIELHALPEFADFVGWLRAELDRAVAGLTVAAQAAVARRFARVVELEVAFFDQAYE
jgi:thiaminase/transcriptional activator TenA